MCVLMGSVLSLFSYVEPIPPQYQVFINFRGDELRKGFIGFLEDALKREKINVFIDHNELRGTKLNNLFTKIEESKIALTIFSKRYTESDWCLDELVHINECMDQRGLRAIPIFFKVEPNDVKFLMGPFGDNFRNPAFRFQGNSEKEEKWKKALGEVSQVMGLCYTESSEQRLLVSSIVEEVKKVLRDIAKREEEEEAEAKRNYMATRTEEVTKCVVNYLTLIFILALVFGPFLISIICILAFFSRSFENHPSCRTEAVNGYR